MPISRYDPGTGICWQFHNKGDKRHGCKCPAHSARDHLLVLFGRCRSGQRWFWAAKPLSVGRLQMLGLVAEQAHGWANTEEEGIAAVMTAVTALRCHGLPIIAQFVPGTAYDILKKLNAAKRAERWTDAPVDGSDTRAAEYLYDRWGNEFRITKKTTQRIYYMKGDRVYDDDLPDIGFVPRHRVADDWPGPTWRELSDLEDRLERRHTPKFFLKPLPPRFHDRQPPTKINLRKLKAAMAAAHPDRGGSQAEFIKVRAEYEAALAATKRDARQRT
jgi:hypothetical protein